MVRLFFSTSTFGVALVTGICSQFGVQNACANELADVLKAWEYRSERVSSWRVVFEGDYTYRSSIEVVQVSRTGESLRISADGLELTWCQVSD